MKKRRTDKRKRDTAAQTERHFKESRREQESQGQREEKQPGPWGPWPWSLVSGAWGPGPSTLRECEPALHIARKTAQLGAKETRRHARQAKNRPQQNETL